MSGQAQAAQVEVQDSQVEEEYHREEKREHKTMDANLTPSKFNTNLLVKTYGDNISTGSFKSGGGDRPLPVVFFFQHASARVAAPIGEPILSGEYPQMDKNWAFWMSSTNPNSHRLTDHDKCVVESLNYITALKYITSANDSSKSDLDDFGQKWNHNTAKFELNRKFAPEHNPDDDSMATGPGIYDNYKRQVNVYGETSVY